MPPISLIMDGSRNLVAFWSSFEMCNCPFQERLTAGLGEGLGLTNTIGYFLFQLCSYMSAAFIRQTLHTSSHQLPLLAVTLSRVPSVRSCPCPGLGPPASTVISTSIRAHCKVQLLFSVNVFAFVPSHRTHSSSRLLSERGFLPCLSGFHFVHFLAYQSPLLPRRDHFP